MNRSLVRSAACVLAAAAFTLILLAVPASSPSAQTITLSGFGCSGTVAWNSNTNTLTCSGSTGSFGCSLSSSQGTSPPLIAPVILTDSCSGALGSVSYSWSPSINNSTNCSPINSSIATANLSAPSGTTALSCTYNVTATDSGNNTGSPNSKSIQLNYTAGGGGGGGGGGGVDTSACTAFGLNAKVLIVAWGSNTVVRPPTSPNFGPNDALIVQFTTSSVTTSSSKGNINAVEYQGASIGRAGALSASPCDFTIGLPKAGSGSPTVFNGWNPSISFSLVNPVTGVPTLQPNTPYYLNITNFVPAPPNTGTQNCSDPTCNMQITLTKPSGT